METMIARRTRQGYNATESRALLETLLTDHEGDNLATALAYNGFATVTAAHKFAHTAR